MRRIQSVAMLVCIALISISLLFACGPRQEAPQERAAYFWRTTFELDSAEMAALKTLEIRKLYVRMFDIDRKDGDGFIPVATTRLVSHLPDSIELVPTVFIVHTAIHADDASTDTLAGLILKRVDKMMQANGYGAAKEVQLDFDWTESNRAAFFPIVERLREQMHARGGKVSVTVRLHQTRHPVPPADYGVLMLYNTGRYDSYEEQNSILRPAHVAPYLESLEKYDLPLSAALPVYQWYLLFRKREFQLIARGLDVTDTTIYRPIDANHWLVKKYGPVAMDAEGVSSGDRMYPGETVRKEVTTQGALDTVARMVGSRRPGMPLTIYHLDSKSLKQYELYQLKNLHHLLRGSDRNAERDR